MAGDKKYGRLFTRADVEAMIFLRTGEQPEQLREFVDRCQTHFPDDEPLFLIRGQDKAGPAAVMRYADEASDVGAGKDLIDACDIAAGEMTNWQRQHPGRVKVPD